MIIGHYHPDIWAKGGIATYIRRISAAQRAAGHTVFYFSQKHFPSLAATDVPTVVANDAGLFQQAEAFRLDILHLHRPISIAPPPHLSVIRTLHGHEPYCPNGSKYLKNWHKPCDRLYSPHGCLWGHLIDRCGSIRPQNLLDNWHQFQQERSILPTLPVVVVSNFLKDCMVQSGYPANSIHVLHLFAPDQSNKSFPLDTNTPRFVFLGRISAQKGLTCLLRALQQVSSPVHLDIAGEGDQEAEMHQLAWQLGLNDRVTFHGWASPDQTQQLIHSARAVIFPSVWHEPAGLVALEAMAGARAVIASQVGGIPEMVLHQENGLLVEPNNVHELAIAIEQLATDYSLAVQLGEVGRKMATEQFTLDNHFNHLIQIYQQAIKLKKASINQL